MGVKGLWRLLLPIGRRISLETLHGKVLAIDASIWLTQFLKAMRDAETGRVQAAAHLIGFFRRLCRLKYHGIKPVFVFDGATPEIKKRELALRRRRRERFETLGGDAAVQRMARRLLAETLKKHAKTKKDNKNNMTVKVVSKKSKTNVAYAAGFHPAGEDTDADMNDVEDATEKEGNDEKQLSSAKERNSIGSFADTPATEQVGTADRSGSQEVIELLEEVGNEEYPTDETRRQEKETNDWDKPVIEIHSDEEKSGGKEGEDDSSSGGEVEYEDFGLREDGGDDDDYHISRISSLPSSKRKDAIEIAKRQQRLRSRKEFMPAAANPQAFSQVQLSNFLRSTKLNKSIVEMATKAAEKDNKGLRGEAMASDRNTRVELIREDDVARPLKSPLGSFRNRKRFASRNANNNGDGSDESSHQSWGREQSLVGPLDWKEDDDENDSDLDRKPAARESHRAHQQINANDDSSDDDVAGGGGFLPVSLAQESDLDRKLAAQASQPLHQETSPLDESSVDVEFASHAGGFLPPQVATKITNSITGGKQQRHCENSGKGENAGYFGDDDVGFFQKDDTSSKGRSARRKLAIPQKSDSVIARELADHALAQALQDAEDEGEAISHSQMASSVSQLNGDLEDDFASGTEEHPLGVDDEEPQAVDDREPNSAGTRVVIRLDGSNGADKDVCWEDGDPAEVVGLQNRDQREESDEDDVDWEDGDVGAADDAKDNGVERCREVSAVPANQRFDTKETLVDGQSPRYDEKEKDEVNKTKERLDNNGRIDEHNGAALGEMGEDRNDDAELGIGDYSDPQNKTVSASDETAAALERAQATASNLANWAGRVFRRAMKEVSQTTAEDSPEKSQHANGKMDVQSENVRGSAKERATKPATSMRSPQGDKANPKDSMSSVTRASDHSQASDVSAFQEQESSQETASFQYDPAAFDPATLAASADQWRTERNQHERDADTVTDEMRMEAIQLLQLFGVPYVEAPAEAEAQCAALEELGLVDGIVTEDSDVFVFGGKTVYKHIFEEMKFVEVYLASDANREMGLGRNQMVALAMLLGGDYTEGVKGVGIVNAMEVLQAFDVTESLQQGLQNFRKWLDGFDPMEDLHSTNNDSSVVTKELAFHRKHRTARNRWAAPDSFPSDQVMKAYVSPVVEKSGSTFTWGDPNVEGLVGFCEKNIGWTVEETMRVLDPVLNAEKSGFRQTRIDSFMKYEDSIKFADVRSKRLREVLGLTHEKEACHRSRKKAR